VTKFGHTLPGPQNIADPGNYTAGWLLHMPERHHYARQRSYSAYMLWQFRLSVCLSVRLSVCLSVCLSHGWISQKRLKLGSRNFHHTVAPSV